MADSQNDREKIYKAEKEAEDNESVASATAIIGVGLAVIGMFAGLAASDKRKQAEKLRNNKM